MSINRVIISGNLTRDPELRATQSGMQILGLGVAVNDRRKNPATGGWEDYPNYVECVMFGSRAGSVAQYLSKGSKVVIEDKLHWSQWERDGKKRSKLEVIIDDIEFISTRKETGQPPAGEIACTTPMPAASVDPATPASTPDPATPASTPDPAFSLYDDDIPF